ncbi:hypothetical protein [Geoglobus acetivorans]|uniref:TFIIB-type domain-containing protein n=1 Tax=Geoglobus acetivorans TaxID=565033 RepID=A0A0A7GIC5_GEOAI|nr:hypothetical protein GACE_1681 [Geoglobus acetivorans]
MSLRILVCPVCNSTDVELDTGGVSGKYYCKNCGYIGSYVMEMTEGEYEEMHKMEEMKKEHDESK